LAAPHSTACTPMSRSPHSERQASSPTTWFSSASSPYRFTSCNTYAGAPSDFPSEWFLPSQRDFTGRENELPIDAHGRYGLIAPRHCLIHTAYKDGTDQTSSAHTVARRTGNFHPIARGESCW